MPNTQELLELKPFAAGRPTGLASSADIKNAYDRARLIGRHYALSLEDVLTLSPRFWAFHLDTIHAESGNSLVVLTTHLNLCIGTLGDYLPDRPALQPLIEKLLNFDINGQFLLTEVGWGVDADELKTTATLRSDAGFELHTPHQQAAKFMSWTTTDAGTPSGAVVFARLIVDDEDRGIRPFWVMLHDGQKMEQGVVSYALPKRAGAPAIDHAVTIFNHKILPEEALLGTLEKSEDPVTHFSSIIHRASIGTLSISTVNVPCLKLCTYIAAKYSNRRHVTGPNGSQIPILKYRTQQRPILHALAQSFVWEAAAKYAANIFTTSKDTAVQSTTAIVFKCAIQTAAQQTLATLGERCGAQGLYEHNTIISCQNLMRGNSFAEGDTVVIAIRLVSNLLVSDHSLPPSPYPDAPLVKYAAGLLAEAKEILASLPEGTKDVNDEAFNAAILPLCQPIAEAMGYALAYEGARKQGVPDDLLGAFQAGIVLQGASWFVQNVGWKRADILKREEDALSTLMPRLEKLLEDGWEGVGPYARAPLLTEEAWDGFVGRLPRFGGQEDEEKKMCGGARL